MKTFKQNHPVHNLVRITELPVYPPKDVPQMDMEYASLMIISKIFSEKDSDAVVSMIEFKNFTKEQFLETALELFDDTNFYFSDEFFNEFLEDIKTFHDELKIVDDITTAVFRDYITAFFKSFYDEFYLQIQHVYW